MTVQGYILIHKGEPVSFDKDGRLVILKDKPDGLEQDLFIEYRKVTVHD